MIAMPVPAASSAPAPLVEILVHVRDSDRIAEVRVAVGEFAESLATTLNQKGVHGELVAFDHHGDAVVGIVLGDGLDEPLAAQGEDHRAGPR